MLTTSFRSFLIGLEGEDSLFSPQVVDGICLCPDSFSGNSVSAVVD